MQVYLINSDKQKFKIAKVDNKKDFEQFVENSIDILRVNESQILLILKEVGSETPRNFFIGCFANAEDLSKQISTMFELDETIEEIEDNEDN